MRRRKEEDKGLQSRLKNSTCLHHIWRLSDSCEVNPLILSPAVDGMQLQQLKLSTDTLSMGWGVADKMP